MVQSNPDQLERGEDGGKREKTSLVREEYVMEREEKYTQKKKKINSRVWWWLGNTLNQLVIPAQEVVVHGAKKAQVSTMAEIHQD